MRILILSQHYPPEPITRLKDLTRYLISHGHQVRVVATFPSYPLGRVYDGYRLGLVETRRELGAEVKRVFALPYRGAEKTKRMLSYGSFAATALLLGLLPGRRPDVIYAYHPPLTTGLAAALYNLAARVPFVYDVQDLWPEAIVAAGLLRAGSRTYRAIRLVESLVYRRAARILVLSEGMKRNLIGKGVPPDKIATISNWGDAGIYKPHVEDELRERFKWQGKTVIMLAGNMGLTHGLGTVLDAAGLLRLRPDIVFVFVGSGAAKEGLVQRAHEQNLGNALFLDQAPPEEAARFVNASDVMLVHLRGGDFSVPHRIFSYMLCAKPIIVAATGSAAELIQSLDCGWVCPPSDASALAKLLEEVAADPDAQRVRGLKGQSAAQGPYGRALMLRQIEQVVLSSRAQDAQSARLPLLANRAIKRAFDIAVAIVALALLSPLIALIAFAVRLRMGSPVLFRQQRPGLKGRPFTLIKFRTMADRRDDKGNPLPDDKRLTAFGRFLRSASLDELPELINVLNGEMSIVGPRPLLMHYLNLYTPDQMRRHEVKPGITGWAQVNGRNTLAWDEKFEMDVWYVEHQSLGLDLRILKLTLSELLRRKGINQEGHATMPEFTGITK